jgi:hypothetical protein
MRVALGTLARFGIEVHLGPDIPAAVEAALSEYSGKLKAGEDLIGIPRQCSASSAQSDQIAFDLLLDDEVESMLAQEAARQGTTASQLAVHSVLVYLAELEELGVGPAVKTPGA